MTSPTRLACGCDPEQGELCGQAIAIWKRIIDAELDNYHQPDPVEIEYRQALIDWSRHFSKGENDGS